MLDAGHEDADPHIGGEQRPPTMDDGDFAEPTRSTETPSDTSAEKLADGDVATQETAGDQPAAEPVSVGEDRRAVAEASGSVGFGEHPDIPASAEPERAGFVEGQRSGAAVDAPVEPAPSARSGPPDERPSPAEEPIEVQGPDTSPSGQDALTGTDPDRVAPADTDAARVATGTGDPASPADDAVASTAFEARADAADQPGPTAGASAEPEAPGPGDRMPYGDGDGDGDGEPARQDLPVEGGVMDRLKDLVGAGSRGTDGVEHIAGTVDRPPFQNPTRKPEGVPDRYATPLDRADGTRTPLFDGEPSREQTCQGKLNDCGIIATLGAVAAHDPDAIRSRVSETEDGNYAVMLHEARLTTSGGYEATGRMHNLTVTPDLPVFDTNPDAPAFADSVSTGAAWCPILEKAIAGADQAWNQERRDRWAELSEVRKDPEVPEGYVRLDKGSTPGNRAELLTQLTGRPSIVEEFPKQYDRNGISPDAQLMGGIRQRLADGKPVLVGTRAKSEGVGGPLSNDLKPEHAYEVTEVDERSRIHLRNPWNTGHPEPLTLKQFKDDVRPSYTTLE
ncbi:hypothetical protein [Streptomyces erythrochromogenes]|uniref:hypothetical protein n=1 Tax=Streptomyces erythrochromogenes TaxID=285574 RepID=UPI0036CA8DC8